MDITSKDSSQNKKEKRKFLGIYFKCCNVYQRIYINNLKNAYEGNCPKCGKKVYIPIGKNGVNSRFFEAF